MAGGGTGGHVVPSLAVAAELRRRGHDVLFIGTKRGLEADLVPAAGFPIEWIDIGGLQRVGSMKALKALAQLPASVWESRNILRRHKSVGVFSTGGYVAGPVALAAVITGIPVIVMEPNAMPGLVSRKLAGRVYRALVSFEEARQYFPAGRSEVTGLPVRAEFFDIPPKDPDSTLEVLVTGGSRGSRALNAAVRASWPLLKESGAPVRIVLQAGREAYQGLAKEFAEAGVDGEVVPFIGDMPAAYAAADVVVSRSGAGAVSELSAAGKPSILVPFPHAADDHQRANAEAMARAGAAWMISEADLTGRKLQEALEQLRRNPERLLTMGRAARGLGKPGAAQRAADLLEEAAIAH